MIGNQYLKKFKEEVKDITVYYKQILEKYINHDKKINIDISIDDAIELIESEGIYNTETKQITIVLENTIRDAYVIVHEFIHKIYNRETIEQDNNFYYDCYKEFLAFYNTLLFKDYLYLKIGASDIEITYLDDIIINDYSIFCLKNINLKFKNQQDNIDSLDVIFDPHIPAVLAAKLFYEERKNKSLEEKIKECKKLLSKKVNKETLIEVGLLLKNKENVKRLFLKYDK